MSQARDSLNAQFMMSDAIREHMGSLLAIPDLSTSGYIDALIKALNGALDKDDFRHLQWAIQRKDAPPDPVEEAWVKARVAADEEAWVKARAAA